MAQEMESQSSMPSTACIDSNYDKTRTRGKKRKGRRDTSDVVNLREKDVNNPSSNVSDRNKGNEVTETSKRRCIGRKPVTDFVVGNSYTGKVVYTKLFGLFLDIGCHSDAFCHISRVSDDFVESIESLYSIGDEVTARVIDIDRATKRITVSMQSENKATHEITSVTAWKERSEKRQSKHGSSKEVNKNNTPSPKTLTTKSKQSFNQPDTLRKNKVFGTDKQENNMQLKSAKKTTINSSQKSSNPVTKLHIIYNNKVTETQHSNNRTQDEMNRAKITLTNSIETFTKITDNKKGRELNDTNESKNPSRSELKRARKIARRADRRATLQTTAP